MAKKNVDTIETWGKKVRYLGSAHSGTSAARRMHLTSVALVPLTIAFVWLMNLVSHQDFQAARATLGRPCPAILMLLFVGAGVWHMQIGMRSIIDDYVHEKHMKEWSLIANTAFAVVVGVACAYSLLKISFA